MEWAVGKQGEIMRENSGKLMLPGSNIVWDIHYHAVGEEITDTVEMAIYFYPKGQEPKFRQSLSLYSGITGGNRNLDIPPNTLAVTPELPRDAQGRPRRELPAPHAPARQGDVDGSHPAQRHHADAEHGERATASTGTPTTSTPTTPRRCCRRAPSCASPSWHDNTATNKDNPDPNQWVGWGDRTVDEMAHAWVNITYMDDADFQVEVDKRKAKTTTSAADRQQQ